MLRCRCSTGNRTLNLRSTSVVPGTSSQGIAGRPSGGPWRNLDAPEGPESGRKMLSRRSPLYHLSFISWLGSLLSCRCLNGAWPSHRGGGKMRCPLASPFPCRPAGAASVSCCRLCCCCCCRHFLLQADLRAVCSWISGRLEEELLPRSGDAADAVAFAAASAVYGQLVPQLLWATAVVASRLTTITLQVGLLLL